MEADPKARKLCRSQKIKRYTRKGLCKRARINCAHVLTISTGYRVPVRARTAGTYCCWYVAKKKKKKHLRPTSSFSHSVVSYVQTYLKYQRCRAHHTDKLGTPASMNFHELWECRDLYAKTKIVRPGGSNVGTCNRDVLGQSPTGCKTSCDFSVESYSDDSTA